MSFLKVILEPKLKKEIKKVLGRHLPSGFQAFFFGSRVRGDNFARADIDIGIEGKNPLPIKVKFAILDELEELPTLLKFDLVDFSGAAPDFKKQAKKYLEPII
jgi:predicted nucleotidyltransferase